MLKRLVDIRAGEGKRALLAFASLLLVIAAYTVVKSVRDALFLSKFGITQLSMIAIGLAVAIGFIISIYLRGTAGLSRNWLIGGTNLVIVSTLLLIWLGLFSPGLATILPWVLYIWSSIFGVFIVMQFWLLANDLFDPREAKRLFGFIGAGAILGGISGGFLSRSLAGLIGAPNLLLLAAGMLALEAFLVALVWPLRRREERPQHQRSASAGQKKKKKKTGGALRTLQEHRSVRLLAMAVLLATVATTLLDWQFKGIVKNAFADRMDEMAGFFGSLYAYLSVASFFVQTFLTGAILRRFGVGLGLLALPVSLFLGSALILFYRLIPWITRLVAASTAKVAEGGLRFSLDKASMELMWLPVPPDVKERGKSFVDTVVDRLGTGLTGFIWLGLAAIGLDNPERIHLISIAVGVLVLVWLVVVLNARGAYLAALRDVLSTRKLDPDRLQLNLVNAEAQQTVSTALASQDPREVLFALYLLEETSGQLPDLSAPLGQDDPAVRVEALRLLTQRGDRRQRKTAIASLVHPDARVREAAIIYLHSTAPSGSDPLIEELAKNDQVNRSVVNVIKLGIPTYAMTAASDLREELAAAPAEQRAALLRLLGGAPPEMAAALLAPALQSEDPEAVCAALLAAGRARATGLVPVVCRLLSDSRYRREAAAALRTIGETAVDHLLPLAQDHGADPLARQTAIQVLGGVRRSELGPALLALVERESRDLSRAAVRALNRLRNSTDLELEDPQSATVKQAIDQELKALYRDLLFMNKGSWSDLRQAGRSEDLLGCALFERADDRVERVFRLLALANNPRDIYAAFLGVRSPLKTVRASSIEFLDNVLAKEMKAVLLPLLEDAGPTHFAAVAGQQAAGPSEDRQALLQRLLQGASDDLLRSVAVWTIGTERIEALRPDLEALLKEEGAGSEIQPQIQRALEQLDATIWEEPKMGLTTIEKALKLQKVDVLQQASTDDLAHIAQIATEVEVEPSTAIYEEGDAPEALFMIVSGKVRLHRGDEEIEVRGEGEAFGSWALIDEAPRITSATALEHSTLLKVSRQEFQDVLADRADIAQAIFKTMAEQLRNLAKKANIADDDS